MTKPITPLAAKRECEGKFTNIEIEILNGLLVSGYAAVAEHASPEFFIKRSTITKLLDRDIHLGDVVDMYVAAGWYVRNLCYGLLFRCPND